MIVLNRYIYVNPAVFRDFFFLLLTLYISIKKKKKTQIASHFSDIVVSRRKKIEFQKSPQNHFIQSTIIKKGLKLAHIRSLMTAAAIILTFKEGG